MRKILMGLGVLSLGISSCYAGFYVGGTIAYPSLTNSSGDIKWEGFNPRFTAGYGLVMRNQLYIGAEGFYGPKSLQERNVTADGYSLKTNYMFGISAMPGYQLDAVILAYARLGVMQVNFKDLDTSKRALQAGGGVEINVLGQWFLRGEYVYSRFYQRTSEIGYPIIDQYSVAAIYRFC